MTETKEKATIELGLKKGYLRNQKVYLKPIEGKNLTVITGVKGVNNPINGFMYEGAVVDWCLPMKQTGDFYDPFDSIEEREFFEDKSRSGLDFKEGDLNIYKRENKITGELNFWINFEYRIHKNQGVVDSDTVLDVLDLSKPMDYIKYKVCLTNSMAGGQVAPSWAERNNQGTYRIVLIDSKDEDEVSANKADKLAEAWKFYTTVQNSSTKMRELLTVYWLENRKATRPAEDANLEWMKKELSKIINENVDNFLGLISSNYDEKLLINKAMSYGIIKMNGPL